MVEPVHITGEWELPGPAQIFAHNAPADIDARLGAALDVLRAEGAVAAYRALNNERRIKYLGAAFFTKVLHFAGAEGELPGPHRPLILDSVVSRAPRASGAVAATWPGRGWRTAQYAHYLAGVQAYADRVGARPDQVELALFRAGGNH
ncbi:hypothetical protein ACIQBJ_33850 [Kitasatospora sp. NPDC088391]|uniref:8-oxoguanine DNA glycosylase OGG fold protein n=1 Tax=Kitasatospora sp. NPDC088391 TaxID=3364074 RepID=UPI0037F4723C